MKSLGARLIAAMLMVGALTGFGLGIPMFRSAFKRRVKNSLPLLASYGVMWFGLFAWTFYVGIELWKEMATGYRWATILYAAQIFKITLPGLSYEFFTGARFQWMLTQGETPSSFEVGSAAEIYLSPQISHKEVGVNIVALAVVLYLLWLKS